MTIDCHILKELNEQFSLFRDCTVLPDGTLRIATAFKYPNGSSIDVFVQENRSLFNGFTVSDFAQTATSLLDMHIDMQGTKKRRQFVEDICESLGVHEDQSQLTAVVDEAGMLPDAIVRVAQACVRVSDLILTQRFPASVPFKDEVEEYLAVSHIQYQPDLKIPGKYGREVPIDFVVAGPQTRSLIRTLSSGNPATAHVMMNELLRCWVDLEPLRTKDQFVTVIDDKQGLYRLDDINRLGDFSNLFGFPSQQEQLREALAA